jgi:hypothetical protein
MSKTFQTMNRETLRETIIEDARQRLLSVQKAKQDNLNGIQMKITLDPGTEHSHEFTIHAWNELQLEARIKKIIDCTALDPTMPFTIDLYTVSLPKN